MNSETTTDPNRTPSTPRQQDGGCPLLSSPPPLPLPRTSAEERSLAGFVEGGFPGARLRLVTMIGSVAADGGANPAQVRRLQAQALALAAELGLWTTLAEQLVATARQRAKAGSSAMTEIVALQRCRALLESTQRLAWDAAAFSNIVLAAPGDRSPRRPRQGGDVGAG